MGSWLEVVTHSTCEDIGTWTKHYVVDSTWPEGLLLSFATAPAPARPVFVESATIGTLDGTAATGASACTWTGADLTGLTAGVASARDTRVLRAADATAAGKPGAPPPPPPPMGSPGILRPAPRMAGDRAGPEMGGGAEGGGGGGRR